MTDITKKFDIEFYSRNFGILQQKEFLNLLEKTKACISGSSVLNAIKGTNPFYKEFRHSIDIDIYVNLENSQPLVDFFMSQEESIKSLCQASPYDHSFFKKNHILQNLSFYYKIDLPHTNGVVIDLMLVKNSVDLKSVLTNFDLTCCQNWITRVDKTIKVYSTHYQEIIKGKCKLNKEYCEAFVKGNKFIKNRLDKYTKRGFDITIPQTVFKLDFKPLTNDCSESGKKSLLDSKNLEKRYIKLYFDKLGNYLNVKPFFEYKILEDKLTKRYSDYYKGDLIKLSCNRLMGKLHHTEYDFEKYKFDLKTFVNSEKFEYNVKDNLDYLRNKYLELFKKYQDGDHFSFPSSSLVKIDNKFMQRSFRNMIYSYNFKNFSPEVKDITDSRYWPGKSRQALQKVCGDIATAAHEQDYNTFTDVGSLPTYAQMGTTCNHPLCDDNGNIFMDRLMTNEDREGNSLNTAVILKRVEKGRVIGEIIKNNKKTKKIEKYYELEIILVIEKDMLSQLITDPNNGIMFFKCYEGATGYSFNALSHQLDMVKECFVKLDTTMGPQFIHWTDACYITKSPVQEKFFILSDDNVPKYTRIISAGLVSDLQGSYISIFGGDMNAVSAIHCQEDTYTMNNMEVCKTPKFDKSLNEDPNLEEQVDDEEEVELTQPLTLEQLEEEYPGIEELIRSDKTLAQKIREMMQNYRFTGNHLATAQGYARNPPPPTVPVLERVPEDFEGYIRNVLRRDNHLEEDIQDTLNILNEQMMDLEVLRGYNRYGDEASKTFREDLTNIGILEEVLDTLEADFIRPPSEPTEDFEGYIRNVLNRGGHSEEDIQRSINILNQEGIDLDALREYNNYGPRARGRFMDNLYEIDMYGDVIDTLQHHFIDESTQDQDYVYVDPEVDFLGYIGYILQQDGHSRVMIRQTISEFLDYEIVRQRVLYEFTRHVNLADIGINDEVIDTLRREGFIYNDE